MLTVYLLADASTGIMNFLPLIAIVVVMYFFMIRPQVKKQKEETKFRSEIKKGDKVITLGGIHAKVLETNDETLLVQAEGGTSKFKINKTSIAKI
ncbi:MAG: preprotein translocase subunit YajC [Flavobacteriales bacterium]|nr:preprotein translocase subunit YajC [Flavobacteriales bacterium]MDG1395247.1 preprotein translocase subunit YajC [Flavobacteriales bacterium]|tara:strand:+ start:152 stop:436 length:285 start_codon:yes stop_codon:yes gene_type:complete